MKRLLLLLVNLLAMVSPAIADSPANLALQVAQPPVLAASNLSPASAAAAMRNGREIFAAFLEGRADSACNGGDSSLRWESHFSHVPSRLADDRQNVLPLFGYVVDALRQAGLPTEFALIPFVESGYRPGARNGTGPAGLWQFAANTARQHHVPMRGKYDGRLSAVDSTRAAVRYLKTLYGMFGGDWRLALMAYNAGQSRVLQALQRAGMRTQNARPAELPGLSKVTYAYVEKLHALACGLDRAQAQGSLLASLDHSVPVLVAQVLPAGTDLRNWAGQKALETQQLTWLNPALEKAGPVSGQLQVLAPAISAASAPMIGASRTGATVIQSAGVAQAVQTAPPRALTHTVRNGESALVIARRYGITATALLSSNGLDRHAVLEPGMVLSLSDLP